ncbi:hypothetical protein [Enterobacter quasiroggenkampii]|uniref:hypothetical protein n=1 Tax=Enterobacter quasiroggenkampii TaxID=2497436 RepID=UPI001F2C7627|nr:hypothetical protein [Enterobacter quasiroggenkampii]
MPKFDEIRNAVTVLASESDTYWNKLQKVMMYFNSQLREYWGITDGAVVDNMGKQHAVISTGIYDESEKMIVPKAPFMLPREGKKLCFDLLLNLPSSDDNQIVVRNVINIKFRYDNGIYFFEAEGVPSVTSCKEIDDKVELTPFFDALHAQLLTFLKFAK